MNLINLEHKDHKMAKDEYKKHGELCARGSIDGVHHIICRCDEKPVVKVDKKKVKANIIDEIDTDGNGHITHKEVEDYFADKDK